MPTPNSAEATLLDRYARGLAAYRNRAWLTAVAHFDAVIAFDASDQPAQLLRARALLFAENPPAPAWDGVWVLQEK